VLSHAYDPGIHDDVQPGKFAVLFARQFIMDCRVKPGNDRMVPSLRSLK
jgi:hypothetical protein